MKTACHPAGRPDPGRGSTSTLAFPPPSPLPHAVPVNQSFVTVLCALCVLAYNVPPNSGVIVAAARVVIAGPCRCQGETSVFTNCRSSSSVHDRGRTSVAARRVVTQLDTRVGTHSKWTNIQNKLQQKHRKRSTGKVRSVRASSLQCCQHCFLFLFFFFFINMSINIPGVCLRGNIIQQCWST